MPKQIKVTDELYERLRARANGQPIPQMLRELLDAEADALLEKLDRQAEEERAANTMSPMTITSSIDNDELPECCQKIYSGRKDDRCEHWTIKNNRWYNLATNRYIDDPAYTNYFQNA